MSLAIYKKPTPSEVFSNDGSHDNPVRINIDGISGGIIAKRFFVRNDDITRYYTDITVSFTDNSFFGITDYNSWFWKLKSGFFPPVSEEWNQLSRANSISLDNIGSSTQGNISTYLPFWLQVQVPDGADVQNITEVKLTLSFKEYLVVDDE